MPGRISHLYPKSQLPLTHSADVCVFLCLRVDSPSFLIDHLTLVLLSVSMYVHMLYCHGLPLACECSEDLEEEKHAALDSRTGSLGLLYCTEYMGTFSSPTLNSITMQRMVVEISCVHVSNCLTCSPYVSFCSKLIIQILTHNTLKQETLSTLFIS